jgi:hypothetical protein
MRKGISFKQIYKLAMGYSLEFLHDFNLCIFVYPISLDF